MNHATLQRLSKEIRALLPASIATVLLLLAAFWQRRHLSEQESIGLWLAYGFGCALLGSIPFGHEFSHQTMGLLLAQPVSRRRLWSEKMFILGLVLACISILFFLLFQHNHELIGGELSPSIVSILVIALIGFCTGPTLTLLTSNPIGSVALTILCPFTLSLPYFWFAPRVLFGYFDYRSLYTCLLPAAVLYCGVLFLLGYRRFQRFQDANLAVLEVALPAPMTAVSDRLSKPFAGNSKTGWINLIKKEIRLQQPTFLIAALISVCDFALLGINLVHPHFDSDLLSMSPFFLCLIVPLVAGIISTAEERNLGMLSWHLTLPPATGMQWRIKIGVTTVISLLLGLLPAYLFTQIVDWQFDRNSDFLEFQPFCVINILVLAFAIYASSFSTNSIRALVAAIAIGVSVPLIIIPIVNFGNYNDWAFGWLEILGQLIGLMLTAMKISLDDQVRAMFNEYFGWLGLGLLLIALFKIGQKNFRRLPGKLWRPVQQMALLYGLALIFILGVILVSYLEQFIHWTHGSFN
jgi:hypothetical protein